MCFNMLVVLPKPRCSQLSLMALSFIILTISLQNVVLGSNYDFSGGYGHQSFQDGLNRIYNGDYFPWGLQSYVSHRFVLRPPSYVADIEIRWRRPVGILDIRNYTIFWRVFTTSTSRDKKLKQRQQFNSTTVAANQTWFIIRDRKIDEEFQFQLRVSRYTKVMNKTKVYWGKCKIANPVPKYLVASPRTVHLYDKLDHKFETIFSSDTQHSQSEVTFGTTSTTKISSVTYIMFRNELYWIDQNSRASIVRFNMMTKQTQRIVLVMDDSDLLVVDYIQLMLYWVENRGRIIYMYDLLGNFSDPGVAQAHKKEIFNCVGERSRIVSLVVDPHLSGLVTFIMENTTSGMKSVHQVEVYRTRSYPSESGDRIIHEVDQQAYLLYPVEDPKNIDNILANSDLSAEEVFGCSVEHIKTCHQILGDRLGSSLLVDPLSKENERLILTVEKGEHDGQKGQSNADFKFVTMSADGCICKEREIGNDDGKGNDKIPPMSSIISATADTQGVTWITKREPGRLSYEHVNSVSREGRVVTASELPLPPVQPQKEFTDIVAFNHDMQQMPPEKCLIPRNYTVVPSLLSMTHYSITLGFSSDFEPSFIDDLRCLKNKMPTVVFSIYYKSVKPSSVYENCGFTNQFSLFNNSCSCIHTIALVGHNYTIMNLKADTRYVFQVAVTNEFSYQHPMLSPAMYYRTSIGPPSMLGELSVTSLNPTSILLIFGNPMQLNGPSDDLRFNIYGCKVINGDCTNTKKFDTFIPTNPARHSGGKPYMRALSGLEPGTYYRFGVTSFHAAHEKLESEVKSSQQRTYELPSKLILESVDGNSLKVSWRNFIVSDVRSVLASVYDMSNKEEGILIDTQVDEDLEGRDGKLVEFYFKQLQLFTEYNVRLTAVYQKVESYLAYGLDEALTRFEDSSLTVRTLPGNPETPAKPELHRNRKILRVIMRRPKKLNCPESTSLAFQLQSCVVNAAARLEDRNCSLIYEGNETSVDFDIGKDITIGLILRVRVQTEYGTSNFSKSANSSFAYLIPDPSSDAVSSDDSSFFGLALTSQAAFLVCAFSGMFLLVLVFISCRNWCAISKFKKKRLSEVAVANTLPMNSMKNRISLLQEAPFRTENDLLYYVGTNYTGSKKFDSLQGLKMIKANYIQIDNLIGAGAFGEVYSAISRLREGSIANARIAVKFLNSNAGIEQKQDFIQEAILMRNFEHPNIVEVYGICMDSEPIGIVMELMQSDLLTFLRQSRPDDDFDEHSDHSNNFKEVLSIKDQIMFAIDIANGCNYLSEHHMLHRDLAARNCLVSRILDPVLKEARAQCEYIVKVGDFGLARDVYKQEYYRKTGNALMPVRWMSPESLIDGIFTSQSDVWSYGVVFWEIMTLGNQPYPGKDNVDVLHFVKSGGRLEPPEACVPELGRLMENCWNTKPSKRPTFFDILNFLDSFLRLLYFSENGGSDDNDNDPGFYSPIYVTPSNMDLSNTDLNEGHGSLLPQIRNSDSPGTHRTGTLSKWDYPCSSGSVQTQPTLCSNSNSQTNYSVLAVRDGLTDDISSLLSSAMSVAAISQNESCNDGEVSRSYMRVCNQLRHEKPASPFHEEFSDSVAGTFSYNSIYLSDAELVFDADHHDYSTARKTLTASTPMERKHKPESNMNNLNYSDTKSYQNMKEDSPLLLNNNNNNNNNPTHQPHQNPTAKTNNYVIKNGYAMLPNMNRPKVNNNTIGKKQSISENSKHVQYANHHDSFLQDSSPEYEQRPVNEYENPTNAF